MKYCQGTRCHTYLTRDRVKGTKDNKTNQTRIRSNFYYGNGNFCSLNCQNDWFIDFGDKAINHFGRTTEAKHLTENNAWCKQYEWDSSYSERTYVFRNSITHETRPITEEQYDNDNYTLNA